MSDEISLKEAAMGDDAARFWSAVPEKALHPVRIPMIEALWWIGKPLSARGFVDVLDGFLTMWEALHHLRALEPVSKRGFRTLSSEHLRHMWSTLGGVGGAIAL
jgi:hypothetical protein